MKNSESRYLSFKGYEVIKLNMNKVGFAENKTDDNIGFLFKIVPNDKKSFSKVNILQGVKINPTEDFPYEIEVVIKGNFELGDCSSTEDKIQFLVANASAILFPYLRATTSLLSSQLEYEKIILPVINFTKIFDGTDLDSLLLEYTQFEEF